MGGLLGGRFLAFAGGTSVLGPQRLTAFVKFRRATAHGEPRTVRSEGAEEAQSLLSGHRSSLEMERLWLLRQYGRYSGRTWQPLRERIESAWHTARVK